ncbi:MAG: hypothetical protein M3Z46_12435, partial [Actinomycetota bacterium]|nr:hypothetical protein [Actinomycetota bacterium]
VRTVRDRWPKIACLLITGYAEAHSLDIEAATMLVPKPFTPEELLRAVAGALQVHPLEQAAAHSTKLGST